MNTMTITDKRQNLQYIYTYTEIYMNIIDYLVYRANILLFRSFLFYTLVLVNVDVVSKELFIYVNEANSV